MSRTAAIRRETGETTIDLAAAGPVTARDAYGNVATGYQGQMALASVFGGDDLRLGYTFTADDAGSHTFRVTLFVPGVAGLVAADSAALAFGFTTLDVLPAR